MSHLPINCSRSSNQETKSTTLLIVWGAIEYQSVQEMNLNIWFLVLSDFLFWLARRSKSISVNGALIRKASSVFFENVRGKYYFSFNARRFILMGSLPTLIRKVSSLLSENVRGKYYFPFNARISLLMASSLTLLSVLEPFIILKNGHRYYSLKSNRPGIRW